MWGLNGAPCIKKASLKTTFQGAFKLICHNNRVITTLYHSYALSLLTTDVGFTYNGFKPSLPRINRVE